LVTHIVFDYGGQHISRAQNRIPVRNEYLPPALASTSMFVPAA
jgi:hypothetical protein